MKLGDKYTLWRTDFRSDAYRDQFDIPHSGYVVVEEIPITVVEVKKVPGLWRQDDNYIGLRAVSADGREFFRNWNYFPDDSMTPCYYWEDDKEMLEDAEQAYNHGIPHVSADGKRAVPAGVTVCEKHNYASYEHAPYGCFKCKLETMKAK